ncbi:MAG: zf-HC2 domain-containing protein [Pseudonocardiaceae bacterium]
MDCAQCKEDLSARLDGEESEAERDVIDAHLTSCAACRRFVDTAVRLTSLARTDVAADEPDVVAAILAAAHPSHRPHRQPRDGDVHAAVAAARWCGCTCCRRLTGGLRPLL